MKRNRIMALLLAGCMVLGNSNALLYAEEADEQLFTIEEDNESEIQEDVMEEQADEEDDLYACDLIEDEEEMLFAAEIGDSEAPVFDASSIMLELPEGQSTVTGGDTVKLSVRVTDASGIDLVKVFYRKPTSGEEEYFLRYNAATDRYETSITISNGAQAGEWTIARFFGRDTENNYAGQYASSDGEFSKGTFTVVGTASDSEAPVFDTSSIKLELPEGQDTVTGGDTVKLSVRVTDASGIDLVKVFYRKPTSGEEEYFLRYNAATDRYETSITISNGAQAGEWTISRFFGRDTENNYAGQYASSDGEFSAGSFTVVGTASDSEAPVFDVSSIELELPEGQSTVTGGDTVKLSVRVTDASGIDLAKVFYRKPTSGEEEYFLHYNAATDRYEASITISNGAQAGEWTIARFFGRDTENNYAGQYASSDDEFSKGTFTVLGKCRVTFDSRGGSEVETQYVLPGDKAVEPEKPTKDEYEFGGWYADEELTVPFDFETPINENTTIYAKWDELPDITVTIGVYDQTNEVCGQGGTYTFNDEDGIHTADKHIVKKGSEVTIAAAPADGYKFVEWVEGEVIEGTEELQIRPTGELGDPESTDTFYAEQDVVLCAVFADENILSGWCGDNVRYELNKNTGLLTISGTGPMTEYAGTDLISPFSDNQEIKKIIVEDGVTTISKRAFESCMKVTEVTLPDSVTEIGEQAFSNCIELQRITLPRNITSIKEETFVYCIALQEVSIPENVTVIGIEAFSHCVKLSELVIPANVTSIDGYAFAGCMDLTSVVVDPGNPVYDSRNNCNAIIDTASDTLLFGCSGTVIPDTVKAIGEGAFIGPLFYYMFYEDEYGELPNNLKLTQIEIPGSVTEIGDWAFAYNIGLVNVSLPEGLQRIGEGAFEECIALQSIVIPDSVTEMGSNAFNWCTALQSVSLPTGISEIKNGTFYGCSALEEIQIPGGVKRIGDQAFNGCSSLSSVTIPDGFETFGEYVFDGCTSLMEIDLPASLTELKRISLDGSGILTKSGAIHYAGSRQQWKKITNGSETMIPQTYGAYDITFEPNGGSAVDPQIVSAGGTVQKPEDPAKDEDVFGGWFTDEALTEPFDFDEVIHADVTLYAKWLSPDTDFDLGNCSVTFDESYRVLDQIESTPYDGWFYVVPSGTVLEPIVKSGDETLTSNYYKASYSECMFYEERNEWDKIDDNAWIDHFPTDAGVYFCKVEGVDPYTGKYEYIDLIRILPGVTFDTRGGSEVATQHMYPGETAAVPEKPTKEGSSFEGWYTEETLTDAFDFSTPISENITLYAKWYCDLSICSYDKTNQADRAGGQFLIEEAWWMDKEEYGGCNCTLLEGNITLKAFPDPRYAFKGWYKGEYIGGDAQISRPLDMDDPENLLSKDLKYTFNLDKGMIICPVFEICTDHDFGPDQTVKATTTAEGRVYHVCKNCGTEVTIKVLPKLKSAAPAEKITVSKKPSIQKPAATKSKITVKWKHFKHTSKKTKKIWKKIKKVQVQCATDKTFKNIVKDVKIGRGKTKYAIKGLARKTTYYVRVRYYDGVGYSAWSKVKKAKTK